MIESTIQIKEINYPMIMSKSLRGLDLVVLFSDKHCGTIIKTNDDLYPIGYYASDWDMRYFTVCNFDVVLSNR